MTVDSVIMCSKEKAKQNLPRLFRRCGLDMRGCQLALLKPNVCGLYHPSLDLLSAVVRHLDAYAEEIVIGETRSMIHDPESQFEKLGINSLISEFGSHLKTVDLSSEQIVKVKVPKPHVLSELELPQTVVESDVFINVPKFGTHSTTTLTNALKNLFGLLPQKRKHSIYHPLGMDYVIADIAQVVKPDLNITDAGEDVVMGRDPLTVDIAACRLMNLDPLKVRHLRLVAEDRGGTIEGLMEKVDVMRC